ncbi:hypothetical protein Patl1_34457 [Pistacia atlantica]|uniref:Uncharacterized protein n=1 Tax=Pistacia atlantica TaxID=434234 RepID=A0ACC0ZTN2_9ROSI|nr:hypothetical protein Patl1_34457 [Pistacia atlantica]
MASQQSRENVAQTAGQLTGEAQKTEQVKNMAQGAGEQVKNMAQGAADAVKNTLGINPRQPK